MRDINPIQSFIHKMLMKGYSDSDLANKIGIPLSNFNGIKNGHNMPSTILFSRMCVEFNLGSSQIFELISYLSECHRNREIKPRGKR